MERVRHDSRVTAKPAYFHQSASKGCYRGTASITSCREYVRNYSNHQIRRNFWCARVFSSPTCHGAGLQPRAGKKQQMNGGLHTASMHYLITGLMAPERSVAGCFQGSASEVKSISYDRSFPNNTLLNKALMADLT